MLDKLINHIPKESIYTAIGVFLFLIIRVKPHGGIWVFLFTAIGLVLTGIGIMKTVKSDRSKKDKEIAMLYHAGLWIFGKILLIIVGWIIGLFVLNLILNPQKDKKEQEEQSASFKELTLDNIPGSLYSGNTWYRCSNRSGAGVEYVNSEDENDRILIHTVYDNTDDEISTDAGHFNY